MRLAILSHKPCWRSPASPTGVATDGGFPMQMAAIAALVDDAVVCVPVSTSGPRVGEVPLRGPALSVESLTEPQGTGLARKVLLPLWVARNLPKLVRVVRRADAVHAAIPGDIGTVGIVLTHLLRKPLFVRHCGNWHAPRTRAERVWRAYMERVAGGRRVMVATGGGDQRPSARNPAVTWIFSTSLTASEVQQMARPRELPRHGPIRLVIAGRQEQAKGTGVAIEALARLRDHDPQLTLEVVGDGVDLPAFRRAAETLGVADRVTFHGRVTHDEVLEILDRCHIFAFPTRASEGFPKVVTEALAAGLPVVASMVSVLPALLGRGGGVVVDATAEAVAGAVEALVTDPDRYRAASRAAVETAATLTLENWQQTLQETLEAAWGPLKTRELV